MTTDKISVKELERKHEAALGFTLDEGRALIRAVRAARAYVYGPGVNAERWTEFSTALSAFDFGDKP
jgi:hypothetical protein